MMGFQRLDINERHVILGVSLWQVISRGYTGINGTRQTVEHRIKSIAGSDANNSNIANDQKVLSSKKASQVLKCSCYEHKEQCLSKTTTCLIKFLEATASMTDPHKIHCGRSNVRRLMTFPSTHQSPTTVKRKARVLTIGTVRLSS